ncbi:MAG: SGNH/GDSL hydrolase family protein [Nitrospirae bacterium]|nr:SGNH/GDSL hydrolase family protein [Nitrospirota bacterium]
MERGITLRKCVFGAVAFLSLALIMLVVCEVTLGIIYHEKPDAYPEKQKRAEDVVRYDELIGWVWAPNANFRYDAPEFHAAVKINSDGLRSDHDYSPDRIPGKRRILVAGDSFTFGHGINNGDTYPDILEKTLDGTEVLNFAVSGYGTDQQLLLLQKKGLRYRPDLVVLGFYKGDIFRNVERYHGNAQKPVFKLSNGDLVLTNVPVPEVTDMRQPDTLFQSVERHSRIYRIFSERALWLLQHLGYGESWEVTEAIVKKMQRSVSDAGSKLLVVIIPSSQAVYGNPLIKAIHHRTIRGMRDMLDRTGIEYLDLTPELSEWAEAHQGEKLYFINDGHFSPQGHRATAEIIRKTLVKDLYGPGISG